jgi:hypothetical protein
MTKILRRFRRAIKRLYDPEIAIAYAYVAPPRDDPDEFRSYC